MVWRSVISFCNVFVFLILEWCGLIFSLFAAALSEELSLIFFVWYFRLGRPHKVTHTHLFNLRDKLKIN